MSQAHDFAALLEPSRRSILNRITSRRRFPGWHMMADGGEGGGGDPAGQPEPSTFSQEDVDRLVSKARGEERRKATEKYADYDDLKTRAAGAKTLEDRVASIEQAARDSESRALRAEIANAKGLTPGQAKRLVGATKDELEADADQLLADIGAQQSKNNVVPTEGKNPKPSDSEERQFVRGLFGS